MLTGYDAIGRKTSETDLAGLVTRFEYDGVGNLTAVVDALNQRTTYGYDEQSNKIRQTDAAGRTTRWGYDSAGRVTSRTLPLGQRETFAYDNAGNRTGHVDLNGASHTFLFDDLNRQTTATYADGIAVTTTYTNTGQVDTITDDRGTTDFDYDERERLIRITYPTGRTIDYGYDDAGNRTSLTTANQSLSYTFDVLNRLATVVDEAGTTTYGYDAVGNRASLDYANGTRTTYTYDPLYRLTELSHFDTLDVLMDRHTYTLGDNGNRTQHAELSGRVVDYTYDNLYRLMSETVTDPTLGNRSAGWTYDAVGNRMTQTETDASGTTTTNYIYDNNDRIESEEATGAAPSLTTYIYDNNGNTLTETENGVTTNYGYDSRNRLTSLNAGQVTYRYDASGIRMSETAAGLTTNYLVDPNRDYAQVVEESFDLNSFAEVRYTYGDDLVAQHRRTGPTTTQSRTFHYDGLGSTRFLTDTTGAITDTYAFRAFGELEGSTGITLNDYLYTGEQYDPNLGFYYLRARYYNPAIGRFPTMDTYAGRQFEPMTLHKYLYVHANPASNIDPSGHLSLAGVGKAVSIAATLATAYSTVVTIGQFASGERELTAKEVGIAFIWVYAGSKAKAITGPIVRLLRRSGCLSNSFTPDTLVETSNGLKRIDEISVGDPVLSLNNETGELEYQPVTAVMSDTKFTDLVVITLETGAKIEATPEHLIFADGRWVEARDLHVDSLTSSADGDAVKVVDLVMTHRYETVYDLTVAENRNFYVSEDRLLVHNISPCEKAAQALAKLVPRACLGFNKCKDFSREFEKLLINKKMKGKRLCVQSRTGRLFSDTVGEVSSNGIHVATQVGDLVFDNFNAEGVPLTEWLGDLGLGPSEQHPIDFWEEGLGSRGCIDD